MKTVVPQPDYKRDYIGRGKTADIMQEVLDCFQSTKEQTKDFAGQFSRPGKKATAKAVWQYIRRNIRYVLDPPGQQLIKTPARTIADGYGDCKSYSVLAASLLYNLGIGVKFRFVSFSKPEPSHVYIVVLDGSKEYPLDACLPAFNQEKPYKFKIDKMPTDIYRLSGLEGFGGDENVLSASFPQVGKINRNKRPKTVAGKALIPLRLATGTAPKARTKFGKILRVAAPVAAGALTLGVAAKAGVLTKAGAGAGKLLKGAKLAKAAGKAGKAAKVVKAASPKAAARKAGFKKITSVVKAVVAKKIASRTATPTPDENPVSSFTVDTYANNLTDSASSTSGGGGTGEETTKPGFSMGGNMGLLLLAAGGVYLATR